jgi:hypothetical protein
MTGRATQMFLVLRVDRVEIDDVDDGLALVGARDPLDGIARTDLALERYGAIEAGPAGLLEAIHYVWPTKPDAELVAGHPQPRGVVIVAGGLVGVGLGRINRPISSVNSSRK